MVSGCGGIAHFRNGSVYRPVPGAHTCSPWEVVSLSDTPNIAVLPPGQPLSRAESSRLERLERTVDRAVEVVGKIAGEALATIRDEKLYRITHTSFEAYVLDRWGFSRATAYRMIEAATVAALPAAEDNGAGQRVSARDKPSTEGGESEPDDEGANEAPWIAAGACVECGRAEADCECSTPQEPRSLTADAVRMPATVNGAEYGELRLSLDPDVLDRSGYPGIGQRVLVAWTT